MIHACAGGVTSMEYSGVAVRYSALSAQCNYLDA